MDDLESLDYSKSKISNLPPLERYKNLRTLRCQNNNLNSLNGIDSCIQLRQLICSYNPISDLTPISKLVNITYLNISGCEIRELSILKNLTNLTNLECHNNLITSLHGVPNSLIKLSCSFNELISLDGLEECTALTILNFQDNGITDLTPIQNCKKLISINADENELSTIPFFITEFRQLKSILITNNPIENIPVQVQRFLNRLNNVQHKGIRVYTDRQNTHNSAIVQSIRDSINRIMETKVIKDIDIF
jgi:Leucine-rich repeat (LRR) protein